MESTINIHGRQVPFRLEDSTGRYRQLSAAEAGALVAQALVEAIHFPVAATVRAVVMVTARTAAEISIELTDLRAVKHIQLRDVTARRFSNYLMMLHDDQAWDPQVKYLLREAVMEDLKSELRRLSQF